MARRALGAGIMRLSAESRSGQSRSGHPARRGREAIADPGRGRSPSADVAHSGWTATQEASDVPASRGVVARIEQGHAAGLPSRRWTGSRGRSAARVLVRLLWQGEGLDRLLDAATRRPSRRSSGCLRGRAGTSRPRCRSTSTASAARSTSSRSTRTRARARHRDQDRRSPDAPGCSSRPSIGRSGSRRRQSLARGWRRGRVSRLLVLVDSADESRTRIDATRGHVRATRSRPGRARSVAGCEARRSRRPMRGPALRDTGRSGGRYAARPASRRRPRTRPGCGLNTDRSAGRYSPSAA